LPVPARKQLVRTGHANPSNPGATQDGGAGHARIQAWRTQDRARHTQSEKSKQAVAIALSEAGASKYDTPKERTHNLRRTKAKERRGETGQAATEGRRRSGQRQSGNGKTRSELYQEAKRRDIPGRSKMNKQQLERALHR
jgi:hypothetical protein